jgi:hypothetical protein
MIHYQLRCSHGHEFDAWFRNSSAFDRQASLNLVECPTCGETEVDRALMAPAVGRRGDAPAQETPTLAGSATPGPATPGTPTPHAAPPPAAAGGVMPDQVRAMLQRLRSEVEKNCDYVGPDFAAEARKIHQGESARRGIYGETTPDQAQNLADEGIEVARIPWVSRADG